MHSAKHLVSSWEIVVRRTTTDMLIAVETLGLFLATRPKGLAEPIAMTSANHVGLERLQPEKSAPNVLKIHLATADRTVANTALKAPESHAPRVTSSRSRDIGRLAPLQAVLINLRPTPNFINVPCGMHANQRRKRGAFNWLKTLLLPMRLCARKDTDRYCVLYVAMDFYSRTAAASNARRLNSVEVHWGPSSHSPL